MAMMQVHNRKNDRKHKVLPRAAAGMLAVAMLFGTMAPTLAAYEPEEDNYPVIQAQSEKPKITVQSNAVINDFNELTGYLEVALIIDPGKVYKNELGEVIEPPEDGSIEPEYEKFRYLSVALEYGSQLTPVSWSVKNADGESVTTEVDLSGTSGFTSQVKMPTLKDNNITTAAAHVGEKGNGGGFVYFLTESTKPVEFTDVTTLAVIRFSYELDKLQPWANADDSSKWIDADGEDCLLKLASPIELVTSSYGMLPVFYASERTGFYYAPEDAVPGSALVGGVTVPEENRLALTTGETEGDVEFTLVNALTSDKGDGLNINDLATILFYDWDDSLIGVMTVPKERDIRAMVNEYVWEHMIYTDGKNDPDGDDGNVSLQDNTSASVASLERKDTYRGEYPFDGPNGSAANTVEDGGDYPLTNKLDYVFYKRPMEYVSAADPTVKLDPATDVDGKWIQADADGDGAPDYDTEYPYIYGWALCAENDTSTTWTTLGSVGELADYAVDDQGFAGFTYDSTTVPFAFADFKTGVTGSLVRVKAVYEPGLLIKGWPEQSQAIGFQYSEITDPQYGKYNFTDTSVGGVYSVNFKYGRVFTDGCGVLRARVPSIAFIYKSDLYEQGITKGNVKENYIEIKVDNKDIIEAELTPSSSIVSIGYYLAETYGSNFMIGAARSAQDNDKNVLYVPDNFIYDAVGDVYADRHGTDGLVLQGTLKQLLEEATLEYLGKDNNFENHTSSTGIITDLNLRRNENTFFSGFTALSLFRTRFRAAVKAGYEAGYLDDNGMVDLTWHQIQHFFATTEGGTPEMLSATAAATKTFDWCRLHEDCIGEVDPPIVDASTLDKLLRVGSAQVLGVGKGTAEEWDAVNTVAVIGGAAPAGLSLRKDINGHEFAEGDDLKSLNTGLFNEAKAKGYVDGTGKAELTWDQIQYYYIHKTLPSKAQASDADRESDLYYWWKDGGTKDVLLERFLAAAEGYYSGSSADSEAWTSRLTPEILDMLALRKNDNGDSFTADDMETVSTIFESMYYDVDDGIWSGVSRVTELTWEQVQYYLINQNTVSQEDAAAEDYWWKGGGSKESLLNDLLAAAEGYYSGSSSDVTEWTSRFTPEMLNLLDLRKNIGGDLFTAGDMEDTGTKFENMYYDVDDGNWSNVSSITELSWEQVQYYLIYQSCVDQTEAEAADFWWKNGGSKGDMLTDLLVAAESHYSGSGSDQWNSQFTPETLNTLELRKNAGGELFTANDMEDTGAKFENMYYDVDDGNWSNVSSITELSWEQVQYYLIYQSCADQAEAEAADFWWKNGGTKEDPLNDLLTMAMEFYAGNLSDETEWNNLFTADNLNAIGLRKNDAGDSFTEDDMSDAGGTFENMYYDVDDGYWDGVSVLTELIWEQIQVYLISGTMSSAEDALTTCQGYPWYTPSTRSVLAKAPVRIKAVEPLTGEASAQNDGETTTTVAEDGTVTETTVSTTNNTETTVDPGSKNITVKTTVTTTTTVKMTDASGVHTSVTVSTTVTSITIDGTTGETTVKMETTGEETRTVFEPAQPVEPEPVPEGQPSTGEDAGNEEGEEPVPGDQVEKEEDPAPEENGEQIPEEGDSNEEEKDPGEVPPTEEPPEEEQPSGEDEQQPPVEETGEEDNRPAAQDPALSETNQNGTEDPVTEQEEEEGGEPVTLSIIDQMRARRRPVGRLIAVTPWSAERRQPPDNRWQTGTVSIMQIGRMAANARTGGITR